MSEEKVLSGMRCAIYNRCSTTEEAQNRAIETQAAESVEIVQALGGVICTPPSQKEGKPFGENHSERKERNHRNHRRNRSNKKIIERD